MHMCVYVHVCVCACLCTFVFMRLCTCVCGEEVDIDVNSSIIELQAWKSIVDPHFEWMKKPYKLLSSEATNCVCVCVYMCVCIYVCIRAVLCTILLRHTPI